ncbi:MAG: glycosyltransferase [Minisyncoccota bacterium]
MKRANKETPKVCFFGIYDPSYSRNKVLIRGFEENGFEVVQCRVDPHEHRGISKFFFLAREYSHIRNLDFKLVIVAFPGHTVVWLARLLFGRPIVFDAFVSLYDSNVFDRKKYAARSLRARLDWLRDYVSASLADVVLLDTTTHIDYFAATFRLPREKFLRVPVGSDEQIFHPHAAPTAREFIVHFHGTFIPLHGIPYIIEAARLLVDEPLRFRIVGSGQESRRVRKEADKLGLTNVDFVDSVPLEQLPALIASAQACLGIFGDTAKTMRVVPNKVFEYMSMGKPIITSDSPAVRELFLPSTPPLILVPPADAAALAEALRGLLQEPAQLRRAGEAAAAFSKAHLTPLTIVAGLLAELPPSVSRSGSKSYTE